MLEGTPRTLDSPAGSFAAWDFGGPGRDLLLVHGTGHNLAVWEPLAALLRGRFRLTAFDMRGHGQTPANSADAEQYWRDIGPAAHALGLRKPLLVGHSTGGYAVTAHAASGGDCAGIVVLDGFVLDGRKTPEEAKVWHIPRDQLWGLFRYGWQASAADIDAYVAELQARATGDWLNDGLAPELIAAFTRRSFLQEGGRFTRRPTMEEIACVAVSDPSSSIYPALDIYDRVTVPAGFVLASRGLYASRREDLLAVVRGATNRYFAEVDCGHNLHMQAPDAVAAFISRHFA